MEIDPEHACPCVVCTEDCPCVRRSNGFPYSETYELRSDRHREHSHPIYECWSACSCQSTCQTRGSQRPAPFLQIHPTVNKGLGVFTTQPLPTGTYITEYYGEHIDEEKDSAYVFEAVEYFGERRSVWRLDAEHYGGLARYFNHSCQPNMLVVPVRTGYIIPRLCFFSLRYIAPGEELTFEYSAKGQRRCRCGAETCRGVF